MAGETDLPSRTETLVVGAGVVGCSTAYHLTHRGHGPVTVVDAGPFPDTAGTSSFAPSGVFQTAPDETRSRLAQETAALARECDAYHEVGSVEVATTEERHRALDRRMDQAVAWGVPDAERLSPAAVADRIPGLDADRIRGGYAVPSDGHLATGDFLATLRDRAEAGGATVRERTRVTDIETADGAVDRVVTDAGDIAVENVVLATNVWTRQLARRAGVDAPIAAAVHQYGVTETGASGSAPHSGDGPWLRHPDGQLYARRHGDGVGVGWFGNEPRLVDPGELATATGRSGIAYPTAVAGDDHPASVEGPATAAFSAEEFDAARASAATLLPALADAPLASGVAGLLAVTPDGNPLLGETPAVDGLWLGAAIRTPYAGGAGRVLAELVDAGHAAIDVDPWHAARVQPHSGGPAFLAAEARATYRSEVGVPTAGGIESAGRTLRESPFFRYQAGLDAEFYDLRYGGWKRPMAFGTNDGLDYDLPARAGRPPDWAPVEGLEHLAVRNGVGMCDLTSFTTFDVVGPAAEEFCQRVFSNDMALPVGGLTYTLMLDDHGGIHGDMTVVRRAADRFHAISNSGGAGTKQIARLKRAAAAVDGVTVVDRIGGRCGLSVTGPDARAMLGDVVAADLDNDAFPYFSARETYVGDVPALALRVSYVGELGWEFHTSMEYGAALWETLWAAGEDYGLVPFGDGALVTLRLEKGFPAYGVDISPAYTPLEAGLDHTVDFETPFVGRDALETQRDDGLERERAVLTLADPDAVVGTGTPVLDGDARIGHVTSAGEGFQVGEFVIYAYLDPAYTDPGTDVAVQYEHERYRATVRDSPLWDPEDERLVA